MFYCFERGGILKKRIIAMLIAVLILLPLCVASFASDSESVYKQKLRSEGFPESYLDSLWQMHQAHPNWVFEPLAVNKDFDTAVAAESASGLCTVSTTGTYWMLISKNLGTYNSDGTYSYKYIDGTHVDCTTLCTSYFMDPRNFIGDVRTIFQFEDNSYPTYVDATTQLSAVEAIFNGTYLDATDTVSNKRFAQLVLEAGAANNVNPCYLASKLLQENGSSSSACVNGSQGYYNYYNIGAYADGGSGANVSNAIAYAKTQGWNTPAKSINGGAAFIAGAYIGKGQSTAYLTKFNVNPSAYYKNYTHQYMSAVHDPAQSANSTYNGYVSAGTVDSIHTFLIPVYNNMPDFTDTQLKLSDSASSAVAKEPSGYSYIAVRSGSYSGAQSLGRVNNGTTVAITGRYRNTIRATYNGSSGNSLYYYQLYYPFWYKISSSVSGYTAFENLTVDSPVSMTVGQSRQLQYSTSPSVGNAVRFTSIDSRIASVDQLTGVVTAKTTGTTTILAYTAYGSVDHITLTVGVNPTVPSQLTAASSLTMDQSSGTISGIGAGTTAGNLLSSINESAYAAVYSGNNQVGSSERLCTGMTLDLVVNGNRIRSYAIAVRGDVNGDGYIKTGDAVLILRSISNLTSLNGAYALAADANGDGSIKTGDAVTVLRSIS
jgi:beta-N-acetylglucosaminidase/uncharacterized protein (DUF2141 family)